MLVRCFDIYANPFLTDLGVPRASAVQTQGVIVEAVILGLAPFWFASRSSQSWFLVLGPAGWCIVFLSFHASFATSNRLFLQLGLPFLALNCPFLVSSSLFVSRAEPRWHATAQSVQAVIQGLGTVTGSLLSGWLAVRILRGRRPDCLGLILADGRDLCFRRYRGGTLVSAAGKCPTMMAPKTFAPSVEPHGPAHFERALGFDAGPLQPIN